MNKIIFITILFFGLVAESSAQTKRIVSGNENSKITIIAYESLTCSHCANFHKEIYPKLKEDFIDKGLVKIEFRNFPLDVAAFNAAKIAQCNSNLGLEILETLYTNQNFWVKGTTIEELNNNLKTLINKKGFDIDFDKCITDKEIEDFVLNDRIEGVKNFKVNSTPTIIINNKKFEKTLNYKNLKKLIEKMI